MTKSKTMPSLHYLTNNYKILGNSVNIVSQTKSITAAKKNSGVEYIFKKTKPNVWVHSTLLSNRFSDKENKTDEKFVKKRDFLKRSCFFDPYQRPDKLISFKKRKSNDVNNNPTKSTNKKSVENLRCFDNIRSPKDCYLQKSDVRINFKIKSFALEQKIEFASFFFAE